eukprot:11042340-Alexandrium_andersonii.AAC.1
MAVAPLSATAQFPHLCGPRLYAPSTIDVLPNDQVRFRLRDELSQQQQAPGSGHVPASFLCRLATINVLALGSKAEDKAQGMCVVGRADILADSLASHGIHLAGLQETRVPAPGTTKIGPYIRIIGGSDVSSSRTNNFG